MDLRIETCHLLVQGILGSDSLCIPSCLLAIYKLGVAFSLIDWLFASTKLVLLVLLVLLVCSSTAQTGLLIGVLVPSLWCPFGSGPLRLLMLCAGNFDDGVDC